MGKMGVTQGRRDPNPADLAADWLTIIQSEMRALAEDRELREAQAAVLARLLHDGAVAGAPVSGPDAPAGAAPAGAAPGARADDQQESPAPPDG